MKITDERAARIAWSFLVEPGDVDAGALVRAWGAVDALARVLSDATPPSDRQWRQAFARWRPRISLIDVDAQRRTADRVGAVHLIPGDAQWSAGLDDLGDHAPLGLHVRGDTSLLGGERGIAVVGARAASGYGEHMTSEIVGDLTGRGASIVSGAAYGIDGAAHRTALATAQPTVAVLAGGVDRVYPAGHAGLLAEIVRSGAVVGEPALGSTPTRWRFLARNRLIAAMTRATLVVEAGWRSGSLNTAAHAASLGRPLGAVPGPVTSAGSAGCHRLLREYDAVCITTGAELAELAGLGAAAPPPSHASTAADPIERVAGVLSRRTPHDAERVAQLTGLTIDQAEEALGLLSLDDRARRASDGWLAV